MSDKPFSLDTSSEKSFLGESVATVKITNETKMQKDYICCRTYFFEGERLKENENESLAYLNCNFPFKNLDMVRIKEIMCSFLNSDGGNIFIGVNKSENGQKIVEGG